MNFVLVCLIAGALVAGPRAIQNADPESTTRSIKVRLLNGKNGKPIKNENPSIWIGDAARPINPYTDSRGEIIVNVNDTRSQELRVAADWYADCSFKGHSLAGVKYSLEEITSTGVVSENLCGKHRVAPIPGVLVLYVRPRTFMEKMRI
jgi:hypothetical protein